jgi:hypothetical protein
MSALFGVGVWAAPILLQEHPQTLFGRAKIFFGIHWAKQGINGYAFVELVDELAKSFGAADFVEELFVQVISLDSR